MRIIIVGAGIIGAAIADSLAVEADVTVIDAGQPGATAASFGWINASFYLSDTHHKLRAASIEAYRGLDLAGPDWSGTLCWDLDDPAIVADELAALDYPVGLLSKAEAQTLEPGLRNLPEQVLHFPSEGAVEGAAFQTALLDRAMRKGAKVWFGCKVTSLWRDGLRVIGVNTPFGPMEADQVIVAAGTATDLLLANAIKLKHRPGLILRTTPQKPLISRILVSPDGEFRQLQNGEIMMPLAVGHQSDQSDSIAAMPDVLADAAFDRLKRYLPQIEGTWSQVTAANRPVPEDDLPIIGPVADGAYAAVMHSGVTLAPIVGQLVAQEVLGGQMDPLLADFRLRPLAV